MLNCPFCEAELGAASNRLRGGRCPKCGSIISWEDDQALTLPDAPPAAAALPSGSAPAATQRHDDDALPMSEIVRTLVERGGPSSRIDDTIDTPIPPGNAHPPAPTPTLAFSSTFVPSPARAGKADAPQAPMAQIDRVWGSAVTLASIPSMTLKAEPSQPDATITDLLIRPFRVGQFGDPANAGAEYELQEVIGEGGVGTVYAARQASIDRVVALKMLRTEFAHQREHRNKFLSEAVVTGDLDHPNIVPIYDLGTSDVGNLFYAMKRVRGTPWSDVIRHQALAENLRILMSVADAVAFAHSRGVIHRDLKPENVMLGDFGEVVVMDWGIALSTSAFVKSERISQTTSMGGTPAYMAPEMATGPLEAISETSDVYLLGAVLYEIITGRPPHLGQDVMSCLYAAARNEIQPTEKSGELVTIAHKAMATKPADRFSSVQDLQAAIRDYQSHSESEVLSRRADEELAEAHRTKDYQDFARALFAFQEARCLWLGNERAKTGEIEAKLAYAATALEKQDFDLGASLLDDRHAEQAILKQRLVSARRERQARQDRLQTLRRTALALAALIFLLLTSGLFFITSQYRRLDQANLELGKTNRDLEVARTTLEEEKRNVESANTELTKTQSRLLSSNVALVAAKQSAISEAQLARQEEQNAAAASYRAQIGVAAERIDNNSFLDAQRLLADYDSSQWSYFRHWEWGHLKWLCDRSAASFSLGPRVESLARSGDARLVAAGAANGQIFIYEANWTKNNLRKIADLALNGPVSALALSADGSRLAAAGDYDQGAITLFQRVDSVFSREQVPLAGHAGSVLSLAFSPSGEFLLSTDRAGGVRIWNLANQPQNQAVFGHTGPVWSAAFSPDGKQFVTAGDDATVRVWQRGDASSRIYRGHDGPVYAVAVSPQGQWIASGGRDRDIHVWKADKDLRIPYNEISRDLERGASDQPAARTPFHTPDHRWQGHSAEIRDLAFSADGAYILSGSNDNTVRRWTLGKDAKDPHFVTVFRGHGGWIRGCVLDASSRYAASGSLDGTIKLWDADEYEEVRALHGHEDAVNWAAFSADGQRIVTASRDRRALLWSRDSREPLLVFDEGDQAVEPASEGLAARLKEGHDFLVSSAAFLPDNRRIITSAGDGSVRVWDRQSGGQMQRLLKTGTMGCLAASRDGRWLVTGSDSTDAQLWSLDDFSSPIARLRGHPSDVCAAAFAAGSLSQGLRIATADVLGHLRLWSFDSQSKQVAMERVLSGHAQGYGITALAFTPDARRLLSASQDHTVLLHDAASGERLPLVLRHSGSVRALDISADGARALTLCSTGKEQYVATVWDLATGAERACSLSLPGEVFTSIVFHHDQGSAILASTGNKKSRLWRWNLSATAVAPLWPGRDLRGTVWSILFSPEGSRILAVGGSQARLLSADKGEVERTFSPHGPVVAANFSPSGRLVATSSVDGDVKLWSVDSASRDYGRVIHRMVRPHAVSGAAAAVNFVAFAPQETADGVTLATVGDDGTARLWRVADQSVSALSVLTGHRGRVRSAIFSPSGQLVITAGEDRTSRLWNSETGQPSDIAGGILKHPEMVLFATFSPSGDLAITGCDDNNAYVWNLNSDKAATPLFTLQGHTAAVTSAAISPDGRRAVTGSHDGIAKLWDLETGKEILSLKRHTAELTSVHFAPDGRSILTSSLDRSALLWPAMSIGPSLKLSGARVEIPREGGVHVVDPQARVFDPDTGDLAGGTLRAWLNSSSPSTQSAAIDLSRGSGLEIQGDQVFVTVTGEQRAVAKLTRTGQPGSALELRLLPGNESHDAQLLLRRIALHTTGPLDTSLTVNFQLTDGHGLMSNLAEAEVQSTDEAASPAIARAAN
jgi:WD40 repeat protein/tRNA A-37 threonylcarbamoyl transferase component Bud32